MSTPPPPPPPEPNSSICGNCGKISRTRQALWSHQRYYCHGPPATPTRGNACPECDRAFPTFMGMRQHLRRAHPVEYNLSLQRERDGLNPRDPWTMEDRQRMAELEIAYRGRSINTFLAEEMRRTVQAVRGQRRLKEYPELLAAARARIAAAPGPPPRDKSPVASTSGASFRPRVPERGPRRTRAFPGSPLVSGITSLAQPVHALPSASSAAPLWVASPIAGSSQMMRPSLCGVSRPSIVAVVAPSPPDSPSSEEDPVQPSEDPILDYIRLITDEHRDTLLPEDADIALAVLQGSSNVRPLLDEWVASFLPPPRGQQAPRPPPKQQVLSSRAAKYRRAQHLFTKDTARCAAEILDDRLGAPIVGPSIDIVYNTYRDVFDEPPPMDQPPLVRRVVDCDGAYKPVLIREIDGIVAAGRPGAAGPDGLTLSALRRIPTSRLALLFNVMVFCGYTPGLLRKCRTTLIPKGAPSLVVGQWRPITVSSLLVRTLHRIIASRLALIPTNASQRGFKSMDGCLGNNILLQAAVKDLRRRAAPHCLLSLDIRRAFDSVPHWAIERALLRSCVDRRIVDFVMDGYKDIVTYIAVNGAVTPPVPILRGVKQGDPLSPVLFNLVLDELIDALPVARGVTIVGGRKVVSLVYADDLVLFAASHRDGEALLEQASAFLGSIGLEVNPGKCATLEAVVVPKKKKLLIETRRPFVINGVVLPSMGPAQQFRYLGHHYGFQGLVAPSIRLLQSQLGRLVAAPLKPQQKFAVLSRYLLPRFLYGYQNPTVTAALLRDASRLVRSATRRILHLPSTCSNAFLHAPLRDGGLGVTDFQTPIPSILMRRLERLWDASNADDDLAAALSTPYGTSLTQRLRRMLGPIGPGRNEVRAHWRDALNISVSGNGLHQVASDAGSSRWISRPPHYWTGRDYTRAVALRGNLLPTKGIVSNPAVERRCRAGCGRVESLSHVLQRCPATHVPRIRRHDGVCRFLRQLAASAGWEVRWEPHIRSEAGILRKPDLVFLKGDQLVVADVGVHWEGPAPLSQAYEDKRAYYSTEDFLGAVQRFFPGRDVVVLPFIIGARGVWCHNSSALLSFLGVPSRSRSSLIERTIRMSCAIHEDFRRAVWARR